MKKIILLLFIINLTSNSQWVQVNSGMGIKSVFSLAVSSNTMFAATGSSGEGIYVSTNNGSNWFQRSVYGRWVYCLKTSENNIYAGTYQNGLFLSTNNGVNWSQIFLYNNRSVNALAINGTTIFAGTPDGAYKSTNNGINWAQTLYNEDVTCLESSGNNVFAGIFYGSNDLYISNNSGLGWTHYYINSLWIPAIATSGNNVFAGAFYPNGGVYKSTNNGLNWTQSGINQAINTIVVNSGYIFVGTYGSSVYVSSNNGNQWIQKNEGMQFGVVRSLCILNNYIFAGTDSSVYRRPLIEIIGIRPISNEVPSSFSLSQNYPNPFNPTTKIRFSIGRDALHASHGDTRSVSLLIYDVLGREIATLVNQELQPGTYEVDWDGSNFPSGIYYYTLSASTPLSTTYSETKKMVLIK